MERNAAFLSEYIKQITGLKLKYEPADGSNYDNNIVISVDPEGSMESDEGYMVWWVKRVAVVGKSPAGVFMASRPSGSPFLSVNSAI